MKKKIVFRMQEKYPSERRQKTIVKIVYLEQEKW